MSRYRLALGAAMAAAVSLTALAGGASATGLGAPADLHAVAGGMTPTQVQYYYPPPGYYAPPPPAYYAPPPVYVPPPRDLNRAYDPDRDGPLGYPTQRGRSAVPYSAMCYAGAYTCQMPVAGPVGSGCSCPGLGAPSYGTLR